jgi:ketosteroid isomerase-like protein
MIEAATELLQAFARSDLEPIERLCAEDVLLVGTDEGEVWEGRARLLDAFRGAFDLRVEWAAPPRLGSDWLFGDVIFTEREGSTTRVRVTMVFRSQLLAHAHYSVAA